MFSINTQTHKVAIHDLNDFCKWQRTYQQYLYREKSIEIDIGILFTGYVREKKRLKYQFYGFFLGF